jgi:hypothetical protein
LTRKEIRRLLASAITTLQAIKHALHWIPLATPAPSARPNLPLQEQDQTEG